MNVTARPDAGGFVFLHEYSLGRDGESASIEDQRGGDDRGVGGGAGHIARTDDLVFGVGPIAGGAGVVGGVGGIGDRDAVDGFRRVGGAQVFRLGDGELDAAQSGSIPELGLDVIGIGQGGDHKLESVLADGHPVIV